VKAGARTAHAAPDLEPVYIWDLVVRLSHWVIVLSMIALTVTGFDLASPFLTSGTSGFTHGYVRIVHMYAAIAFSLAVGARLVWMFLGPRRSGWREFVPSSKARLRALRDQIAFYMLLRPHPPHCPGHNPLAGLSYVAVFGLYVIMIVTGFALYSVSAHASYMKQWAFLLPLFGGAQPARWIHHVTMWLLIVFAVSHICFALLTSRSEKNGTLDSIFSGYKFLSRDRKPGDE
jgi:Ni/Fe-hydrogenase 1 B-type cytochrome subunit